MRAKAVAVFLIGVLITLVSFPLGSLATPGETQFSFRPDPKILGLKSGDIWPLELHLLSGDNPVAAGAKIKWSGPIALLEFNPSGGQSEQYGPIDFRWVYDGNIPPDQQDFLLCSLKFRITGSGVATFVLEEAWAANQEWEILRENRIEFSFTIGEQMPLADIKGNWASSAINRMLFKGIVNGFPDQTFKPDKDVTRAEMAKIICLWHGLIPGGALGKNFSDLPSDHWGYSYISAAVNAGFFSGYPDGTFRPDEPVTKAQLIKLIVMTKNWNIPYSSFQNLYPDCASHWARPFMEAAYFNGLIKPKNFETKELLAGDMFGPDLPATRAQVCFLLDRASTLPEKSSKEAQPVQINGYVGLRYSLYADWAAEGALVRIRQGNEVLKELQIGPSGDFTVDLRIPLPADLYVEISYNKLNPLYFKVHEFLIDSPGTYRDICYFDLYGPIKVP